MIAFDELNVLIGNDDGRNIDIDTYFDEMDISEESAEERKQFTRIMEDELFQVLALLFLFLQFGNENGIEIAKKTVEQSLLNTINFFTQADSELTLFSAQFAALFVDKTIENARKYGLFDDSIEKSDSIYRKVAYFFSQVRARSNAADLANSVFNHDEFRMQKGLGKTYKRWNTIMDGHERASHAEVNGTVIPIDDYFHVGAAFMRYPRDVEAGDFPEETVNCRCSLTYYTTEEFRNISRDL